MILQLKITLKGSKPPVWRRVEIRDSMSFYELHRVIQKAFEWMDMHLHGFDIIKSNSERKSYFNAIGPSDTEEFGFVHYQENEEEVLLGKVFKKEKDKVLYTYDYGDNWEHEILLEKVLEEEAGTFYPRCTKAFREAPEEESRSLYLETGIETESVDQNELLQFINEEFQDEFSDYCEVLQDSNFETTNINDEIDYHGHWYSLLESVGKYKQLQPWKWIDDDQIIVVVDPITKENVYCSIMGGANIEYGLAAYIGEEGSHFLRGLINQSINENDYLKQRSLLLSFVDREELANEDYQILKEHGKTYRGKNSWPLFRSLAPGYYPWFLEEEEVRLFTLVIEQVIEVSLLAKKEPIKLTPYSGTFLAREFDQKLKAWNTIQITDNNSSSKVEDVPVSINEIEIQDIKNKLKRMNIVLEFDCDYFLSPVQDGQNERPYYPILTLALNRKNGLVVYHEMSKIKDSDEARQNLLLELIKKLQCIPGEIWVNEKMAHSIKQIAKKLNIKLMVVRSLPFIKNAREEMKMMFFD